MPETIAADSARRSDAIAIARVICILGVVYVHAWTGLNGEALEALRGTAQDNMRWGLMEIFGRSAVPLLGLISGWLVAGSSRAGRWSEHVRRKARTILLPMILWNVIAIILVSGAAWLGTLSAPIPKSAWWAMEEIFIISRNPDINVQMPFLRDLFLCMVAAPLLIRLPNWMLVLIALAAASCHIAGIGPPLLMRASILCFFSVGIIARRSGWSDRAVALPLLLVIAPFALAIGVQLYVSIALHDALEPGLQRALDLSVRFAAALAFWRLAWAVAGSRARDMILRIEPFTFFLFCAHLFLIWLFGPMLGGMVGPLGSPLYPVYLLVQPLLVLAAVIPVGLLLRRVAPGAAEILSGGRLKAR